MMINHRSALGFTLIELLIAMLIFAMLSVAGWQVFDSVSRSQSRGKVVLSTLSAVQYAYLQWQRDMSQVVQYDLAAYDGAIDNTGLKDKQGASDEGAKSPPNPQTPPPNDPTNPKPENNANNANTATNPEAKATQTVTKPIPLAIELNDNRLRFLRFADPDPRYQTPPLLLEVTYYFADDRLLRTQRIAGSVASKGAGDSGSNVANTGMSVNADSGLTSVILKGVTGGKIEVLTPAPQTQYPSGNVQSATDSNNSGSANSTNAPLPTGNMNEALSITDAGAKGVSVSFSVPLGNTETPLSWQFVLPSIAQPLSAKAAN